MKRGADKQLSKDDADDDVEEIDTPAQGLQKADEAALSQRKIRGLPKRSSQSPAPTLFPAVSSSTSPFAATFKLGSSTGPTGSSQPSPFLPLLAPVASSASNATKAFASFINPAASTINTTTTTAAKSADPTPLSDSDSTAATDDAALKYYTSLRGLNTSFLSTVSKAVESDPFLDIADVLEQYKKHRISVQREYDDKSTRESASPAVNGSSVSAVPPAVPSSSFAFGTSSAPSAALKPPTMPAPPTTFAGFRPAAASSSSTSFGGNFSVGPDIAAANGSQSSSFKFPSTSSAPTQSETLSASSAAPPKPSFSFDTPPSDSASTLKSNPFALPAKDAAPSLPFSLSGSSSSGGTSLFGLNSASPNTSSLFGRISSAADKPKHDDGNDDNDKPAPSPFGTSTPVKSASSSSSFGSPTNPFVFGGGGSGSIGNPVGFGFGSPTGSGAEQSKSGSIGFSFAAPPAKAESSTDVSRDGTPLSEEGQYDKEGEGEEEEETTHAVKASAYKMVETASGVKTWKSMGPGMLRLKKHTTTDARRVLHRTSAMGKVTINFRIYKQMHPTLSQRSVFFTGFDDEKHGTTYQLRLRTEDDAAALLSALEREIAFVKSSE
ncbi:hypothetical protein HETIRDRAFT_123228 [Heterobasidion irregulare TC 32-1]|uniref:RanBD1 domain-containing protein n=1 Tax=Heterobasidion irregulare (strain TC 32-1) TaxID=747525 RepID=W4K4W2_HETIT|nr:uncharacterized protein HETIRDRAFT_123228 [Heterobasidion irregulare TC 32-1]ETW80858.1 hypothetical protein HETIRDRAFT_123228 [Heterobasidion irregulare TC 32-1]